MIIKTADLKKSLTAIMPGIESGKVIIEGADLIVFVNKKMMSYNGKVAVSIPMDLDADGFGVKAKDLYNLVSKIKTEDIELEPDVVGNKLKIVAGKLKATLIMQDIASIVKLLGKVDFGEEKPLPANFVDATKLVQLADNATVLAGFAVGKIGDDTYLISTDKIRISAYKLDGEMTQCFVDDQLIVNATGFGTPVTYSVVGPWFNFGFENGMHFSVIRKDDTQFPYAPMANALNKTKDLAGIASFTFPKCIAEVADRVTTMGNIDANAKLQCELKMSTEKLVVIAEKSTGTAEEEVDWDVPAVVPEPVQIFMPVKTLINLAGKSPDCKVVELCPGKRAVVIKNDNYCMIASCSNS